MIVKNQSLLDEFPELLVILLDLLALHGLFQYGLLVYPTHVTTRQLLLFDVILGAALDDEPFDLLEFLDIREHGLIRLLERHPVLLLARDHLLDPLNRE